MNRSTAARLHVDPLRRTELAALHLLGASPDHHPTGKAALALDHLTRLTYWLIEGDLTQPEWGAFVLLALRGDNNLDPLLYARLPDARQLAMALARSTHLRECARQMLDAQYAEGRILLSVALAQSGDPVHRTWDLLLDVVEATISADDGGVDNVFVREEAAHALGQLGLRQPVPEWVWDRVAASALNPAVDSLRRQAALRALGELGAYPSPPEWVWSFLLDLAVESDGDARHAAAEALGNLSQQPVPVQIWDQVLTRASDPSFDERVRTVEARAFGKLGAYQVVPMHVWNGLVALASAANLDEHVRAFAAQLLGLLAHQPQMVRMRDCAPDPRGTSQHVPDRAWGPLSDLVSDPHLEASTRLWAAVALGYLGIANPVPEGIWGQVAALAVGPAGDVGLQDSAVHALGDLGSTQPVPERVWDALVGVAVGPGVDVGLRMSACRVLGRLGHSHPVSGRVWDALVWLAVDSGVDAECSIIAVNALGGLGCKTSVPDRVWDVMVALTVGSDSKVKRSYALSALGRLGSTQPVPERVWDALVGVALGSGVDVGLRDSAVRALGELGSARPVPGQVWDALVGVAVGSGVDVGLPGSAVHALGQLVSAQPLPERVWDGLGGRDVGLDQRRVGRWCAQPWKALPFRGGGGIRYGCP